jgi:hypothetical protein
VKRISRILMFGSGVLGLSLAAHAQSLGQGPYYPQREDPYRNGPNQGDYNDGRYQRGYPDQSRYGNGYGREQGSLVGRVLSDLDAAATNARLDGHERKHFDTVAQKLQEFEERLAQGKFDTGKLDKAIENLEHLADADRISGRDRDILARDLQDLRQFRSNRGRYSNYGYGDYRDDRYNQNRRYDPRWR